MTGSGDEVPGTKETPTLLGERARATRWGATGRAVMVWGLAEVDKGWVDPVGSATIRELPSEEVSESLPPVVPCLPGGTPLALQPIDLYGVGRLCLLGTVGCSIPTRR
ncbi:hypothetical protein NDU88_006328 [Pleurodeles waltl]|uniref:Uncharacterized protein n=1 Tax=Pleurodeles waltl TaxID=8319 RepID=A0AAV7N6X7_PLEWA|nr:hypothetical protein NDU88_006328 [Pleurodeles waltl]